MSIAAVFSLIIVGALFPRGTEGFKCYTCASDELYEDWQMTGFPKKPSKNLFVKDYCTDPKNWPGPTQSPISFECSTACVTLILQKTETGGSPSKPLWVRGCVDKLLGYDPKVQDLFCQAGNIKRFDSLGQGKDTLAQVRYCKTDQCNAEYTPQSLSTCDDGGNGQQRTCAECSAYNDDCDGPDTCTGNWCTKMEGYLGTDTKIVTKGCSPFNLYGSEQQGSMCQRIRTSQFLSTLSDPHGSRLKRGVTIPYDGTQCFCNDKERCNAGSRPALIGFTLIPVLLVTVSFPMIVLYM